MGLFSLFDAVSLSEPLASLNVLPASSWHDALQQLRVFRRFHGFAVQVSRVLAPFGVLLCGRLISVCWSCALPSNLLSFDVGLGFGGMMTSSSDMDII